MLMQSEITQKLQSAFEPHQVDALLDVIGLSYNNLVKVSDFSELKAIVQDLAESQKAMGASQEAMGKSQEAMGKTLQDLAESQRAMAESQRAMGESQRAMAITLEENSSRIGDLTEVVRELAVAQQRTEAEVEKLTSAVGDIRSEIGGMSRSMSYALENEAYRALPAFLLENHGIEVTERLIRTSVNGEEINFLGRAVRDGRPVLIVGESKQRLDERRSSKREEDRIFSQLEAKAEVVRAAYPDEEITILLITHFARPEFLRSAAARSIVVVQSFEW
jgi:hypothetical protein